MSRQRERYKANRDRVYEIYGIPKNPEWNCHHYKQYRHEGGNDKKDNLIPMPIDLHDLLHEEDVTRQKIHNFCERKYGGDPYQQHNWDNIPWVNRRKKKKRARRKKRR